MRVDHRGAGISTAEQLLKGTDVVISFTQVGGKRIPEGMAPRSLDDPCLPFGLFLRPHRRLRGIGLHLSFDATSVTFHQGVSLV
jgi:hypothetical protein